MEKLKLNNNEKDYLKFDEILDDDGTYSNSKVEYSEKNYFMKKSRLTNFKYDYFILENKLNGIQYLMRNKKV